MESEAEDQSSFDSLNSSLFLVPFLFVIFLSLLGFLFFLVEHSFLPFFAIVTTKNGPTRPRRRLQATLQHGERLARAVAGARPGGHRILFY